MTMKVDEYIEHSRLLICDVHEERKNFLRERFQRLIPSADMIIDLQICNSLTVIPQLVKLNNMWYIVYDEKLNSLFDRLNAIIYFSQLGNLNSIFYEMLSYRFLLKRKPFLAVDYLKKHERAAWEMPTPEKNEQTGKIHEMISLTSMIMELFVVGHEAHHVFYGTDKDYMERFLGFCIQEVAKELQEERNRAKNKNPSMFVTGLNGKREPLLESRLSFRYLMNRLQSEELIREFYSDCQSAGMIIYHFHQTAIPQHFIAESIVLAILHLSTIKLLYGGDPKYSNAIFLRLRVLYYFIINFNCEGIPFSLDDDPTWSIENVHSRYAADINSSLLQVLQEADKAEQMHDTITRPTFIKLNGEEAFNAQEHKIIDNILKSMRNRDN